MAEGRLLLVEDDANLCEALVDTLLLAQYECHSVSCAEEAILFLKQNEASIDLVISDVQMQGIGGVGLLKYMQAHYASIPLLLMTAFATIDNAIAAIKQGAVDYLPKPFSSQVLLDQVSRYLVPANVRFNERHPVAANLTKHQRNKVPASHKPVAEDPQSLALLTVAKKVAMSDATVMVLGPSGTGKEVLAQYIHQNSLRAKQPFVAINCAAIPDNMLEATLFGYEKGAFTGAHQAYPGKFEQAQGGSLLLDEISEIPLALQAKLLRVLQERELERLGGRKTIKLDVRILATSNRDLKQSVSEGAFREDLYYRINVFPLTWLALKDRPKDIIPLADYLLQRHCSPNAVVSLSKSAKERLLTYPWPGNVRELDNVLQRALILSEFDEIDTQDLMLEDDWQSDAALSVVNDDDSHNNNNVDIACQEAAYSDEVAPLHVNAANMVAESSDIVPQLHEDNLLSSTQKGPLAQLSDEKQTQEYRLILATLHHYQGQRKSVAEQLGISPRTLRYKMAKMRELGFEIPSA